MGAGSEDDYAVYGNFFYQNRNEALFQGEGNVALYSNLFVNEYGDAIRIQPHNDIQRRIVIAFNTVGPNAYDDPQGRRLRPAMGARERRSPGFHPRREQSGNPPLRSAGGEFLTGRSLRSAADLYPRRRWPRRRRRIRPEGRVPEGRGFQWAPPLPGTIGAYSGIGTNPGWRPRLERKPE
jgi:hypothetical protein